MLLTVIHLVFAVLAVCRIVELFLLDRITAPIRAKFPSYIWQCSRCLSVWAGVYAALAFAFFPWANWPFALSWLYFTHNDWIAAKRQSQKGRQLLINVKNDKWTVERNELNHDEIRHILGSAVAPQPVPPAAPQPQTAPAS